MDELGGSVFTFYHIVHFSSCISVVVVAQQRFACRVADRLLVWCARLSVRARGLLLHTNHILSFTMKWRQPSGMLNC